MALSLESIYKPVNDFFLNKFQTSVGSPVFFRFDKHATKVADEDFTDPPNNPDEEFSDFVNRVPVEETGGLNVLFLNKKIDESYRYELLSPAIPFIAPDTNSGTTDSIEKAFGEIHSHAINSYDEKGWQARRGVADSFWVSYATPGNWYDRTNSEIWEKFTFQTTEPVTPAVNTDSKPQLWKLRMDDTQLQSVLPALKASQPAQPQDLQQNVLITQPSLGIRTMRAVRPAAIQVTDHRPPAGIFGMRMASPSMQVRDHRTPVQEPADKTRTPVQQNFHNAFLGLNFTNKIAVANFIKEKAPTVEVKSNNITISFDYCVVTIRRPWLVDVFLDNTSWYIPGRTKGELSGSGNLSVLPTGFIAVKNLRINGNWTQSDIENAKNATDFGPFQIDSKIDEQGNVGHEGIQVMGWILQRMNALPPNDSPK